MPDPRRDRVRSRAEDGRHELAELANLYHTAPVGLCFVDTDLRYVRINEHLASLHGLSPGEHAGRSIDEVIPHMADVLKPIYRRVIETGEPVFDLELCSTKRDESGSSRVWLASYVPVKHADGRIAGVSAAVREITSHKRAIDDLRIFQRIVSTSPDHVAFVDTDYVYRAVSDAYVVAHGRPRDQLVGRTVAQLLGEKTFQGIVKPRLDRCLAGEEIRYQEWFSLPAIGRRFMDVVYRRHVDTDGEVAGVVVSIRDMTERRRVDEELRESQMRLARIANTIEDVVWITDWHDRKILFANPAYEQIWGHSIEQLYRNPADRAEAIHPEDRARAWENFARLGQNERYDEEYRIVRPDGSIRWVRDRGYPLRDRDGEIYQVVGIAQDITERKQAEETRQKLETQLRHVQKMQAVGQLAAGVAHDVNSLLMVILGNAELAQGDLQRSDDASVQRAATALTQIQDAVERGKTIVQKLLAFGRARPRHVRPANLNELVAGMEPMLARLIGDGIRIEVKAAPDLKRCTVDAGLFEQVIMNLVLNARDAIPNTGTVTVQTANVALAENDNASRSTAGPGPHVMLAVSDTGVGMDEETLERVFEPFFSTKPMDKGTGLGLAIVYGIVEQAGGHISVDSEPGKGTTFRLYFPAVD